MKHLAEREIATRAVEEVSDAVRRNRSTVRQELQRLGLDRRVFSAWRLWECVPSTFALSRMCAAGYDVVYILTGRRCS